MDDKSAFEKLQERFIPKPWDPSYEDGMKEFRRVYGLEDNPKFDKAFKLAWENGHGSGWYEVLMQFDDLVELIR